MTDFPYYHGVPDRRTGAADRIPAPENPEGPPPENYVVRPELRRAVNVALLLGKPLLLTGAPGTGKTQLAYHVAHEFDLGRPLKFETKSTTQSRDIFYYYDTVARFHASREFGTDQPKTRIDPVNFVEYRAMGEAILRTRTPTEVADWLSADRLELFRERYTERLQKSRVRAEKAGKDPNIATGRERSVVLIDEVDKAPRDVPNDILNEIEHTYFRVSELGNAVIEADRNHLPIVIITSNSEKGLPDAFLRRCIYFDISFPLDKELKEIIGKRIGLFAKGTHRLMDEAISFFLFTREPTNRLRKPPGTAELLDWLGTLKRLDVDPSKGLRELIGDVAAPDAEEELPDGKRVIRDAFQFTLFKTAEDQDEARDILKRWYQSQE